MEVDTHTSHHEKKGADHKALFSRVNKIEGQVRSVKKMIEDGKYCVDIITQVKAARSALKSLELSILEGHVGHCFVSAIDSGSKKEAMEKVEEVMELIRKSSKS